MLRIDVSEYESKAAGICIGRVPGILQNVQVKELRELILAGRFDLVKVRSAYANEETFDELQALGMPYAISVVNYRLSAKIPPLVAQSTRNQCEWLRFCPELADEIRQLMRSTFRSRTFTSFVNPYFPANAEVQLAIAEAYALSHMNPSCPEMSGFLLKSPAGEYVGITYGYTTSAGYEQEYVGVLAAARGSGYGKELYALIDRNLCDQGVAIKFGDISIDNGPSLNSLLSASGAIESSLPYFHLQIVPWLSSSIEPLITAQWKGGTTPGDFLANMTAQVEALAGNIELRWRSWANSGASPGSYRLTTPIANEKLRISVLVAESHGGQPVGLGYLIQR